jgi:hypothetical protein
MEKIKVLPLSARFCLLLLLSNKCFLFNLALCELFLSMVYPYSFKNNGYSKVKHPCPLFSILQLTIDVLESATTLGMNANIFTN